MYAHRRARVLTCTLTNNVVVHIRRSQDRAVDRTEQGQPPPRAPVTVTVAINGSELWEDPTNRGVSLFAAAWLDSDYASRHKLPQDQQPEATPGARGTGRAQVDAGRFVGQSIDAGAVLDCDAPPPVSVDAAALQDALLVRISGTPEQVRGGLDWLVKRMERFAGAQEPARACAPITPEWFEAQRERLIGSLASTRAVRSGAMSASILRAMCAEPDARLLSPTPQMLRAITPELVASWLERHVCGAMSSAISAGELTPAGATLSGVDEPPAPHDVQRAATIEASICGDIELAEALRTATETLGRLPERLPPSARADEPLRAVPLRDAFAHADAAIPAALVQGLARTGEKAPDAASASSACLVLVGFSGTDIAATEDHRTLRAVCAVLTRRADAMLVERGLLPGTGGGGGGDDVGAGAGGISAGFAPTPALAYPSIGLVSATVSVSPRRSEAARAALLGAIDDLATRPPSLEELAEATATLARQAEEFERDDRAWSVLLSRARSRGLDPDSLADGAAFYRALTPATVSGALARFASAERRFSVRLCPQEPGR